MKAIPIAVFGLFALVLGSALCAPLLDAAWSHFGGGHPTVLRWLVSGAGAVGGIEVFKRGIEQLAMFVEALRHPA